MEEKRTTLILTLCLVLIPITVSGQAIQSHFPLQSAVHVPLTADISVTFDVDMDAATFTSETFLVTGNFTGRYSGAISYDAGNRTATFNPDRDFACGERLNVALTSGIQSETGIPLAQNYTWVFVAATGAGTRNYEIDSAYIFPVFMSSIKAADFNRDGDIDISVMMSDDSGVAVMSNSGGVFTLTETVIVGPSSSRHCVADFNGDAYPDIAVTHFDNNHVAVFLNDGTGHFPSRSNYPGPDSPFAMTTGDINGDGRCDLAAIGTASPVLSIFPNLGDGTFGSRVDLPAADSGNFIQAGDVDNDGDIDLVVSNTQAYQSASLYIYLNDGNGGFGTEPVAQVMGPSYQTDFGDVDGDTDADLIYTSLNFIDEVYVLMNDGTGAYTEHDTINVRSSPTFAVSTADMDGDGTMDLISSNWGFKDKSGAIPYAPSNVSISMNSGLGYFLPFFYVELALSHGQLTNPWDQAIADYNGDGKLDIAISLLRGLGSNSDSGGVFVIFNTPVEIVCGDANSSATVELGDAVHLVNYIFKEGPAPDPLCKGDASGDGSVDVGDAVYIIRYVFSGGDPPVESCCD